MLAAVRRFGISLPSALLRMRPFRRRPRPEKPGVPPRLALAGYTRLDIMRRRKWLIYPAFAFFCLFYGFAFAIFAPVFILQLSVPIVVLAALVVWLLPDGGSPPVKLMTFTFFAYFVSLQLWPYYLAVQFPGMPLVEPRRLFTALAVGAFLIGYSISEDFRGHIKMVVGTTPGLYRLYAGFLLCQILSLAATPAPGDAFSTLVNNQFRWTAILFIASYILAKPGMIKRWVQVLCITAVILSVIAFAEFRNQQILWANHIPWFLKVNDPAVIRLLTPNFRDGIYRATATFSVSLAFAEFMALTLPFFLHQIFEGKTLRLRWLAFIGNLMVVVAILMTRARVGMIGLVVGYSAYILFWSIRGWLANRSSIIWPAITFAYPVAMGALIAAVTFIGRVHALIFGSGSTNKSSEDRIRQALKTPGVLVHRPLFGFGPNQGGPALNYRNPAGELSIDSGVLAIVLDYGVIGFIFYYAILIYMIYIGAKLAVDSFGEEESFVTPAAIALLVWLVSLLVLAQTDNTSVFYMILALIAAVAYRRKLARAGEQSPRPLPVGQARLRRALAR